MAASKVLMTCLSHYRPLTCAASSAAVSASSAGGRLVQQAPDLINWVRREGGFVHKALTIAQDPYSGLGLVASEEIPQGADLIALPHHLPLRFESGDGSTSDSILENLAGRVPEELWAMKLGLKLLRERAKVGSFWWPYISNLPESYTVPIFFQGDDIKNLQYAPLLYQVNKRCRFLLEFEQQIRSALSDVKSSHHPFGGLDIDASSLGWSMSAVSSRAFRLHGPHSDIPMMLPLIDMCNHSFNPNASILQEQRVEQSNKMLVKVVAEKKMKPNDELLLNYGCLSNDLFLLDYGFVVPSNPYDCIELKYDGAFLDAASMAAGVSSPNFSSPSPWKKQILSQLNLDGPAPSLKVTIGGSGLVEDRLLAALRIILADDKESVQKHELETLKSLSSKAPCGIATEAAAYRTLIALCAIALEHFPTKVMEDESVLKNNGLSASTKLVVAFRIHKKLLIIDVMRSLSKRLNSPIYKKAQN